MQNQIYYLKITSLLGLGGFTELREFRPSDRATKRSQPSALSHRVSRPCRSTASRHRLALLSFASSAPLSFASSARRGVSGFSPPPSPISGSSYRRGVSWGDAGYSYSAAGSPTTPDGLQATPLSTLPPPLLLSPSRIGFFSPISLLSSPGIRHLSRRSAVPPLPSGPHRPRSMALHGPEAG